MRKSKKFTSSPSMPKIGSRTSSTAFLGAIASIAVSMPVCAHPGHAAYGGLVAGFVHPLSGIDHLLAMFIVGVWAAQLGGRAVWAIPLAFVSTMALGAAGAMTGSLGIAPSAIESGIAASLLVLGLLAFRAQRLPVPAALALVSAFAAFHGAAHGNELPASADPLRYAFGFLASTLALQGLGLAFGAAMRHRAPLLGRIGGAATVFAGALALIGSV